MSSLWGAVYSRDKQSGDFSFTFLIRLGETLLTRRLQVTTSQDDVEKSASTAKLILKRAYEENNEQHG